VISHINKLHNEILQVDRIELVKTLLEESPYDTFIQIRDRSLFENTLMHLINETSWNQYKNNIEKKMEETTAIVNHLKENFSNIDKEERMQYYETEKQLHSLYVCKSMNDEIDDFIKDTVLQEIISEKNEIRKYHSDSLLEKKFKKLAKLKSDCNEQYIKKYYLHDDQENDANTSMNETNALTLLQVKINDLENEINKMLRQKAEVDNQLLIRLKTIDLLEKEKFKKYPHRFGHKINTNLITEESMEMAATSDEFVMISDEKIHVFNILPTDSERSGSLPRQEHLSLLGEFFRAVPLVNDFIRGLIYLREGYAALKNKETSHRDLKIGTAVLGSSLSIGMGVVGVLLLAGAGLMATGAAIFLTPIVLGASILGVFSITLARDSLILRRIQKQTQEMEKHLTSINKELSLSREIFVTNYIHNLKKTGSKTLELISIQEEIETLRVQITNSPDLKINQTIMQLCEKRNHLIAQNNDLSNSIHDAYQKDPRITRITLQRVRCLHALHKMEDTKITAKKKVGLSTLSIISFALIFSTLFIPGVGALVVGGIATAAVLAVSTKRLYDYYQRKTAPPLQNINKNVVPLQTDKASHTSVLRIDKQLFAHHQHQIADALVSPSPYVGRNDDTNSAPKPKVKEPKQLTPEDEDTESFNQHKNLKR
jgi:hypothetical protein